IEPEKSQSGPDHRSAQDSQFAGAGDVVNIEVLGKEDIPRKIRDKSEAQGDDDHWHDCETNEAICEIDRVSSPDDDEGSEQDEEPAKRDYQLLEKRKSERACERLAPQRSDKIAGTRGDHRLKGKAKLA